MWKDERAQREGRPSGRDRGRDRGHGLRTAAPKDEDGSVPEAEISAGATESLRKGRTSGRDEDRGLTQRRDSSGPRSAGAEGPGRLPPTPRAALCLGGLRGTGSGPGGSNVKHEFLVGQELVFTINT